MFFLVDCNNFYASCEEVFQPSLKKKPLVILSNNDGCIIARSQKAKELDIPMGAPIFHYKKLIQTKQLIALSANFPLYGDMSDRIMQILLNFSFSMEIYSIDEAFLFTEADMDYEKTAKNIRETLLTWTGIPVAVGIGKTKTLAKLASSLAKKEKSGILYLKNTEKVFQKTSPSAVWGIGKKIALHLKKLNIHTIEQFLKFDETFIKKRFGVTLLKTYLELKKIICIPIDQAAKNKKSILSSRSFSQKITNLEDLYEAVSAFTSIAAEKLRKTEKKAQYISVFLMTSPFEKNSYYHSCHFSLPYPTSYTPELISYAKKALFSIFKKGLSYKKAGVMLADFTDSFQEDFFCPIINEDKKNTIMRLIDQLNKYEKKIYFASDGMNQTWKKKAYFQSPKFTTSWKDLLKVR